LKLTCTGKESTQQDNSSAIFFFCYGSSQMLLLTLVHASGHLVKRPGASKAKEKVSINPLLKAQRVEDVLAGLDGRSLILSLYRWCLLPV